VDSDAKSFLKNLVETPSPSGYEQGVQRVVRDYVGPFADQLKTDVHGNVIACKNPGAPLRIMLAGHCDQIGMLITYIDENGFLYAQTIGGWDPQQLIGQRMTVWTRQGPVAAVIARKPIHLLNEEERKQVAKLDELWLDIGACDQEDAARVITIGDPVTLALGWREMRNDLVNSPGMDDATGLWVVIEALRRVSDKALNCALYAVSTVQEEIGLRGSKTSTFGIEPHVGIAVDVTHATDCPTIDPKQRGTVKLGGGPVIFRGPNMNPFVTQRLMDTATERQIPFQAAAIGRATPNDANSIQITGSGVATGLLGVPNRYMHSAVETISLQDLDHAADLLAALVEQLNGDEDFTPR
jgi:putative aminopeptidase FrvX